MNNNNQSNSRQQEQSRRSGMGANSSVTGGKSIDGESLKSKGMVSGKIVPVNEDSLASYDSE